MRGAGAGESVTVMSSVKAQMCLHLDVDHSVKNMDHCFSCSK